MPSIAPPARREWRKLITNDKDGAICSNGFAVLRNIRRVEPLYLLACMRTEFFLQVRGLMTGHAIPAISNKHLAKIWVPIPSRAKQQKIANEISAIMALRKETLKAGERIVNETKEMIRNSESKIENRKTKIP